MYSRRLCGGRERRGGNDMGGLDKEPESQSNVTRSVAYKYERLN